MKGLERGFHQLQEAITNLQQGQTNIQDLLGRLGTKVEHLTSDCNKELKKIHFYSQASLIEQLETFSAQFGERVAATEVQLYSQVSQTGRLRNDIFSANEAHMVQVQMEDQSLL